MGAVALGFALSRMIEFGLIASVGKATLEPEPGRSWGGGVGDVLGRLPLLMGVLKVVRRMKGRGSWMQSKCTLDIFH
jgi:hypothetical protein